MSEKLAAGNPSIWARGDDDTSIIFRMGTVNEEDLEIVSDKLKELLYAKAAERVENLKPNASAGLFDNEEGEDNIETETEEEE